MSARNPRPRSIESADKPRKSVSVYDKLAEARERRAEVLAATQPANLPTAAYPHREASRPAPTVEPSLREVPEVPELPKTGKPTATPTSHWLARALTVLLVILVVAAAMHFRTGPEGPGPAFAPPEVSLSDAGTGERLDTVNASRADQVIPMPSAPSLRRSDPGELPTVLTAAPALRGPVVIDTVEVPEIPSARPAGIVTLSNNFRPPHRPDDISSNLSSN